MARIRAQWIVLATIVTTTSGCSSVFKAVFAPHGRPALASASAAAPALAPYTDSGRAQLAAGNLGTAVELLQHALGTGEPAGPALNALAVAYARLGRPDTARRLFSEAIAIEPGNQAYAANLARLMSTPSPVSEVRPELALAGPAAAPAVPPEPADSGRLIRISPNEFRIVTLDPAAPRASGARRGQMAVASRKVRVAAGESIKAAPPGAKAEVARTPAPASRILSNPFVAQSAATRLPAIEVGSTGQKASPADPGEKAVS